MSDLGAATLIRIRRYATMLRLANLEPEEMNATIIITLEEAQAIVAYYKPDNAPVGFVDRQADGSYRPTYEVLETPIYALVPGVLWAKAYGINLIIEENVTGEGSLNRVHPVPAL